MLSGPCLALLLVGAGAAASPAPAADREFHSGYAGHLPTDRSSLARTYFGDPAVRQLLAELEAGPVARGRIDEALKGKPFGVADLLRVGLLRAQGDRLHIGFSYFTAKDMRAIARSCDRRVPALVQGFLARRGEFERILAEYEPRSVSRPKLAFVLVSGFSLNWDGLAATRALGYRRPLLVRGDGWSYSFWASESLPGRDTRGFYWGSSTLPTRQHNIPGRPADFAFSSYGDPFSDPRMSLPDLLFMPPSAMVPGLRGPVAQLGTVHETSLGLDLRGVLGLRRIHDFATILFALRQRPQTVEALASTVGEAREIGAYLGVLEAAAYVERDREGRYQLLVPVFDAGDRAFVQRALALSRAVITGWLEANYAGLKEELGVLTAMQHGVPFEALFTQIWHEVFGQATRELARAGFTFDPRGEGVTHPGSLPALWKFEVYDFEGE